MSDSSRFKIPRKYFKALDKKATNIKRLKGYYISILTAKGPAKL